MLEEHGWSPLGACLELTRSPLGLLSIGIYICQKNVNCKTLFLLHIKQQKSLQSYIPVSAGKIPKKQIAQNPEQEYQKPNLPVSKWSPLLMSQFLANFYMTQLVNNPEVD